MFVDTKTEFETETFWDLETLGIKQNETAHHEKYLNEIYRSTDGRYEVKLPFKTEHPIIPDNFQLAKKRLENRSKTHKSNPVLLGKYNKVFLERKELGIIEEVNEPGKFGQTHYLPHHEVLRKDKQTTKLRVVFDASGPSLNECLEKVPQLTPLLFDILLHFRTFPTALTGDIEKAFFKLELQKNTVIFKIPMVR